MKITDIRFAMLRVPLKTPFKTALRAVDMVEDIIVTDSLPDEVFTSLTPLSP